MTKRYSSVEHSPQWQEGLVSHIGVDEIPFSPAVWTPVEYPWRQDVDCRDAIVPFQALINLGAQQQ